MENKIDRFSLPDMDKFVDPHCLPLFNNFGPNSKAPNPMAQAKNTPNTHTLEPYVTGTSVLGIKYKDGVMLAADTLASYGSLARFRDIRRISSLGKFTLMGSTGELSDSQYLIRLLDNLIVSDDMADDGSAYSPHSIHSYLTRILYEKRNKMDPLWGHFVIAGFRDGISYLGMSDLRGGSFQDETIATGYGAYIARPLLRNGYRPDLTKEEAKKLLESCLRVLYYRDARSLNRVQYATITAAGPEISEPYELDNNWDVGIIQYGKEIKTSPYVFNERNSVIH